MHLCFCELPDINTQINEITCLCRVLFCVNFCLSFPLIQIMFETLCNKTNNIALLDAKFTFVFHSQTLFRHWHDIVMNFYKVRSWISSEIIFLLFFFCKSVDKSGKLSWNSCFLWLCNTSLPLRGPAHREEQTKDCVQTPTALLPRPVRSRISLPQVPVCYWNKGDRIR